MAKCICNWPTACDGNGTMSCRMPLACMCSCGHEEVCFGCDACWEPEPWESPDDDVGVEDVP